MEKFKKVLGWFIISLVLVPCVAMVLYSLWSRGSDFWLCMLCIAIAVGIFMFGVHLVSDTKHDE